MTTESVPLPDLGAETQRQKTALLYRNAPATFVVTLLNASVLTIVHGRSPAAGRVALLFWVLNVLLVCLRLPRVLRYRRLAPQAAGAPQWLRHYLAGTAAVGILWGAGSAFFLLGDSEAERLFTCLVIAGMVAGAVPVLSAVRPAFLAFAIPTLLPTAGKVQMAVCGFCPAIGAVM